MPLFITDDNTNLCHQLPNCHQKNDGIPAIQAAVKKIPLDDINRLYMSWMIDRFKGYIELNKEY